MSESFHVFFNKTLRQCGLSAVSCAAILTAAFNLTACSEDSHPQRNPEPADAAKDKANSVLPCASPHVSATLLEKRSLTVGETALAAKLFGDALDTSHIQICVYKEQKDKTPTYVFNGDTINMNVFGKNHSSADYSLEKDKFLFGAFAHEMARLWQQQQGKNWRHADNEEYAYALHSQLTFNDYGPYQQAAIIEDYARRFFHTSHDPEWLDQHYSEDSCKADDFLIPLVENQFLAAKSSREALDNATARGLTRQEAQLIEAVFGESYDEMRLTMDGRECGKTLAITFNQKDVSFYASPNHENDYTTTTNLTNFGSFLHEATHIWQRRHGFAYTNWQFVNKPNAYSYPLDTAKWNFKNYSVEQQGAMVEDYARYFLTSKHQTKWLYSENRQNQGNLEMVRALVEDQFPNLVFVRTYFEENGKLPLNGEKLHAPVPLLARGLTEGEVALAQKIFGETLDTAHIQIRLYKTEHKNNPTDVQADDKYSMNVFGKANYQEDFSQSQDPKPFGNFAHEMTRLWQQQQGRNWRHADNKDYAYVLNSQLEFTDYGPHQQAAIVEDYVRRVFHSSHNPHWLVQHYSEEECSADDFLFPLVEKQFPNSGKERLKIEKDHTRLPTAQEIALMQGIFGETYNNLNLIMDDKECQTTLALTENNTNIRFLTPANHSSNYALTENVDQFTTFVREVTHIWQGRHHYSKTNNSFENKPNKYKYPLDTDQWSFKDYSVEQQAAMVEDYAGYFLSTDRKTRWLRGFGEETASNLAMLRTLVEAAFPQAKITHQYFDDHGHLPQEEILVASTVEKAEVPKSKIKKNFAQGR